MCCASLPETVTRRSATVAAQKSKATLVRRHRQIASRYATSTKSYPQKHLPPVHPQQDAPEDNHHREAAQCRLKSRARDPEYAPNMPVQRVNEKARHRPGHDVNCNRVHPDHNQRECPVASAFPFDQ